MARALKAVLDALSGWEGYALALVLGLLLGGSGLGLAAWHWQTLRYERQLAELEARQAREQLGAAQLALGDLQNASALIHQKAVEYAGLQSTLGRQLAALREDLKHASPLPRDCHPDDVRVRQLGAAVSAAQQAAAAR